MADIFMNTMPTGFKTRVEEARSNAKAILAQQAKEREEKRKADELEQATTIVESIPSRIHQAILHGWKELTLCGGLSETGLHELAGVALVVYELIKSHGLSRHLLVNVSDCDSDNSLIWTIEP